jgi:hypothetical protein
MFLENHYTAINNNMVCKVLRGCGGRLFISLPHDSETYGYTVTFAEYCPIGKAYTVAILVYYNYDL